MRTVVSFPKIAFEVAGGGGELRLIEEVPKRRQVDSQSDDHRDFAERAEMSFALQKAHSGHLPQTDTKV